MSNGWDTSGFDNSFASDSSEVSSADSDTTPASAGLATNGDARAEESESADSTQTPAASPKKTTAKKRKARSRTDNTVTEAELRSIAALMQEVDEVDDTAPMALTLGLEGEYDNISVVYALLNDKGKAGKSLEEVSGDVKKATALRSFVEISDFGFELLEKVTKADFDTNSRYLHALNGIAAACAVEGHGLGDVRRNTAPPKISRAVVDTLGRIAAVEDFDDRYEELVGQVG